jgi:predicted sulfurtransferase
MDLTNSVVSQQLTSLMHPHSHVILFYRYFLPTDCTRNDEPSSTDESISSSQLDIATLQFFQKHSKHYLLLLRKHQHDLCESLGMKGRILISTEGINGTLSCREKELKQYQQQMESFDLLCEFDLPDNLTEVPKAGKGRLFAGIDWKISAVKSNQVEESQEPFPDLKVQIVKEIVNTGGTIDAADIPVYTGKEISPDEFHHILEQAKANQGCVDPDKKKEVVLIDVRNTFEHAIGHFVHPHSNQILSVEKDTQNNSSEATPAINPNTVTFSHFDSNFCSKYSDVLKDKKVLMYCTGGIRCVKASAMLKKRGVEDVSHLSGGIHRYLERYASEGFYKGKCMVFDQRIALDPDSLRVESNGESHLSETGESKEKSPDVVGKCIECQLPYDELSGANLCTVCRDLILVCQKCRESKNEYHCNRHQSWKNAYFTFLDGFAIDELEKQSTELQQIRDSYEPKEAKNVRRTLRKQIEKVRHRINELNDGSAQIETSKKRRCRTCFESVDICDGLCWGFWKHSQTKLRHDGKLEPIVRVNVGDRVQPGPNWNELRYGAKFKSLDSNHFKKTKTSKENNQHESCAELKAGTVVEVKSWCSGEGDECDCVAVVWDDSPSVDCSRRKRKRQQQSLSSEDKTALNQTNIYRWGTLARNGRRLYDVELLPV